MGIRTLKILTTLLVSLMLLSSVLAADLSYFTGTFPASGGTTVLAAYPIVFDTIMLDVIWQDAGAGNFNLRIVQETPFPYITQFSTLSTSLSNLLFFDNPTVATVTDLVTPVQSSAALAFSDTILNIGVVYYTTGGDAAFGAFNVKDDPNTVLTAFTTIAGPPIDPINPRVAFDEFNNQFVVYAIDSVSSGLFRATFSVTGVQTSPWAPVNAAGIPFSMFEIPIFVDDTLSGEIPIIFSSTTLLTTYIGETTLNLFTSGPFPIDATGSNDVGIDSYATSETINFIVNTPRGGTSLIASEVDPTTGTVASDVEIVFGSQPSEVEIAGARGGAGAGQDQGTVVLNQGGTTQSAQVNFDLGTFTGPVTIINVDLGAANTKEGGVAIITSSNGGGKGADTGIGGGATLAAIGIGGGIVIGPNAAGANVGKGGGGQGGGGAGGGGAGAGGGGAGANPGAGVGNGFIPPFDFMPTGYGSSARPPWDSTNLYFAPCSTLTTAVRNFVDNVFQGAPTGSDLPYQNSAPFTTSARLRSSTQIASVEYRECMTGAAQLLSLTNVFPEVQGAGFIGTFSSPAFGTQYYLVPISFGVRADKLQCVDSLTFKDAGGATRHIALSPTLEGVTVYVASDPTPPIRVRLLDSTAAVVYDSDVDTPPSTETDVTTMIFTGFTDPGNIGAQATPMHGATYDFLNWNYVDTATEFRVDAPFNNVHNDAFTFAPEGDAVCGMRLVHVPADNKFAHQISRTPNSPGNTIPIGTTNNQIYELADFPSNDPFGTFAEQRITTPVSRLFSNGFDMGVEDVSATPEFSPTTLLLAVLLGGMFVMFVVRRRKA